MLHRTVFTIVQRTICTNSRIFSALGNTAKLGPKKYNVNFIYPYQNFNFVIFKRFKSKKGASKKEQKKYEEEQDDDDLDIEDYLNTDKSNVINITIPSLRLDAVAKAGFGISRAKLDKEFYRSNLRINGEKCLRKSDLVQVGDEIDLIHSRSTDNPDYLIVNRCTLVELDADPETCIIHAKFVQNKSLLIEDYNDKWHGNK